MQGIWDCNKQTDKVNGGRYDIKIKKRDRFLKNGTNQGNMHTTGFPSNQIISADFIQKYFFG